MKIRSLLRKALALAAILGALGTTGCAGLAGLAGLAGGLGGGGGFDPGGGGIDLSGGQGGGGGGFDPTGGTGGDPLAPGSTGGLPQPGAFTPPPGGAFGQTPATLPGGNSQNLIAELASRGISVGGSPSQQALQNTVLSARQLRKENTQQIRMNFLGNRTQNGIAGIWSSGTITIYAMNMPTAIFHEMCHHATLYGSSRQGSQVGQAVMRWIQQRAGGNWTSWPRAVTTGEYARKNEAEWQAEFFSVMRVMDLRLQWDLLAEYASGGQFNPPAELRQLANTFYDPAGAGQPATPPAAGLPGTAAAGNPASASGF